jgi:hypothetical protein
MCDILGNKSYPIKAVIKNCGDEACNEFFEVFLFIFST